MERGKQELPLVSSLCVSGFVSGRAGGVSCRQCASASVPTCRAAFLRSRSRSGPQLSTPLCSSHSHPAATTHCHTHSVKPTFSASPHFSFCFYTLAFETKIPNITKIQAKNHGKSPKIVSDKAQISS